MKKADSRMILFIRIIIIFLSITIFINNLLLNFECSQFTIIFSASIVLFLSFYLAYVSRNNWSLLIIYACIAYINYSICMANYISFIPSFFTTFATDRESIIGLNIMLLFMLILFILMPRNMYQGKKKFIQEENYSFIISLTAIIALILIFISQFNIPIEPDIRGSGTAIREYSVIIFIIAFYYSGNNSKLVNTLVFLLALFSIQTLIYGGRVTAVQLAVIYFIVFMANKVKLRKIIPLCIFGIIVLQAIGMFRASISFSLNQLSDTIQAMIENKLTVDTAYAAYYSSLTFVKVENIIDYNQRFDLFLRFLLSMIVGGGKVPFSSLPLYTINYYVHYGGGLLPFHFHFYIGWLGVLLSSVFVAIYMRLISLFNSNMDGAKKCVSLYLTCSVFRWYIYSPSNLIRGVLLTLLVYYVSKITHNVFQNIKIHSSIK